MKNCISLIRSLALGIALMWSATAAAQKSGTVGLGVKAGDPTGLSVKFYQPSFDVELVLGRPYYFSGYYYRRGWYEDRFYKYDKFNHPYYKFKGYAVSNPIAFQVHFLKSKATKNYKQLKWYYGGGPQFRAFRTEYFYYDDRYRQSYSEIYTNIDLGLDGVLGLEYTFSDLPLSIFGDVNLFLEIADDPGRLSLQGGLGVRYNLH